MDFIEGIRKSSTLLQEEVFRCMRRTWVNAYCNAKNHSNNLNRLPQEPDFIAQFLEEFLATAKKWDEILEPFDISLSLATVYCHQRPYVNFKNATKDPEIGDLLIVHFHHAKDGSTKNNALLLQAKMTEKRISSVPISDYHQLELYRNWPVFTFSKPKRKDNKEMTITPNKAHNGARYLLINNSLQLPFYTSSAHKVLVAEYCLSQELLGLLTFSRGKTFTDEATANKKSDWSTTIWHLLNISFDRYSKRNNIGKPKFRRFAHHNINTYISSQLSSSSHNKNSAILNLLNYGDASDYIPPEEYNLTEGEGEGIPIIVIETSVLNDSEQFSLS